MEAMLQREAGCPLSGEVRVDDAYLGGERTGGKVGRGSENKVAFVAAVELHDGYPWRVRFDPVANFSYAALRPWAERALSGSCHVISDGLLGFGVLSQLGHTHEVRVAPKGKAGTEIEPFRWLNTLLGNLKTALGGTHHAFKFAKYADRYLADVQYRFNRRMSLPELVPRLAFAVMHTSPNPRRVITSVPEIGT